MMKDVTFETIMDRMLERIDDSFDKRPSSPIYVALAPAALEIVNIYAELEDMWDEAFADTASRENLIKIARTRGITPNPATNAVVLGTAVPDTVDIAPGTVFTSPEMDYTVAEKKQGGEYILTAMEAGETGNRYKGEVIPAEYIEELESMTITDIVTYGVDEEGTEAFRERYMDSFEANEFGGNRNEYKNKTLKIPGVGAVKVFPVWDGPGTVKLVVQDKNFEAATQELIQTVQNIFDPDMDGMGDGIAPIGHIVTVDTVEEIEFDISTTITYDSGYDWETCSASILQVLESYLLSLRKEWSSKEGIIVRISSINTELLSVQEVIDIRGTMLNAQSENVILENCQVPVLGGVSDGQ